ncbi:hypothetical protein CEXT_348661 [Caerostris extrusa]|uniref:Uncharacterized protein n=1 Tax=Caerostris extrusa TaxID=172846 RepID=A0AAV4XSH0_CAEEX|nr:hypothetical protein CEXT_348661 [Caerostris extrusa]
MTVDLRGRVVCEARMINELTRYGAYYSRRKAACKYVAYQTQADFASIENRLMQRFERGRFKSQIASLDLEDAPEEEARSNRVVIATQCQFV